MYGSKTLQILMEKFMISFVYFFTPSFIDSRLEEEKISESKVKE